MDQCWQRWRNYCFSPQTAQLVQTWCVGRCIHHLNASLPPCSRLERIQTFQKWSPQKPWHTLRGGGSQQNGCCALFTNLSSQQNGIGKRVERRANDLMKVTWCHVLPRSFIRGSTLIVKLVYEAIFPSGEAMPTWASYILRLVGFLGRGWTCWRGNQNWTENHYEIQHFFFSWKRLKIQYIWWVIMNCEVRDKVWAFWVSAPISYHRGC